MSLNLKLDPSDMPTSNHVFPRGVPDPTEGEISAAATRLLVSTEGQAAYDDLLTLAYGCHGDAVAAGWHHDIATGTRKRRDFGEMFMLAVSELAEGMEGHRKNRMDDKLPHRPMLEVEIADFVIRMCDTIMVQPLSVPLIRGSNLLSTLLPENVGAGLLHIVRVTTLAENALWRGSSDAASHSTALAVLMAFDFARKHKLDLPGAIVEKKAFNRVRKDHSVAARLSDGGKAY